MSGKFGTRKITAEQMVELERIFHEESQDADGLDMDQFVKVFQAVLGEANDYVNDLNNQDETNKPQINTDEEQDRNNKRYLTHLFMKIDANSDGTVDWEEFLNFLLMENQGLEYSNFDQQRDMLVRENMPCDNYHSNHSNMISSILHFPNQSRYVTGSLDGTIKLWDTSTFQIKKSIMNSPNGSWVMDLVYLPLSNQIAAVSMDGIINVYNPSSWKLNSQFMNKGYVLGENYGDSKKFNKEEQRWLITSTPVCANGSVLNGINELLSIGTENGKAFLYILNNNNHAQDNDNNITTSSNSNFHICSGDQSLAPNQVSIKNKMYKWNKGKNNHGVHNKNIQSHKFETNDSSKNEQIISPILGCSHLQPFRSGIEPHVMDIHNDWITHIEYLEDLQSLVTCSLDSQIRFSDIERRKKTRIYMGHSRGVHNFSYNPEYKFMASCGVERKIHIFDPHRCARLQLLVGHATSVSHVLMNEQRHQIISLSYDKVIKIWDTRTFRCLQTLYDKVGYQPDNRISSLLFDNDNKRLITCSSKIQSWPIRFQTRKSQVKSHDAAVSAAYFNKHFEQCVSSDFNGNIHVWDIENSSRVSRYSQNTEDNNNKPKNQNHQNKEQVTALTFDTSQRRVITGTDIGTLKMWNFSSGQCLCEFRDHHCKYAHWKIDLKETNDSENITTYQHGTEITGIVYVMEVTSWNEKDVQHWFESFRDKELRNVGSILIEHGINGMELLELNHDILTKQYKIENIIFRRKILNAIAGLYQSNIASRYIVSVGWDNKIRVWIDSTNNKKPIQHPITVMPSENNLKVSNQTEILCIAHYPPVYVVTGGTDGSIAIWNVVSGHFQRKEVYPKMAKLHQKEDVACTQVSWLAEFKLIVTGHSNGTLVFWNPNYSSGLDSANLGGIFGYRHTAHKRFGGITCMVTAKKSTIIVTVDNTAMLQIFDLSDFTKMDIVHICTDDLKPYVKRLNIWCTGHNHITCIDYLDSKDLILTCGHDGEIILWNNKGFKIGMFGQMTTGKDPTPKLWNLNDPKTFVDKTSRSEMDTISDEPEIRKKHKRKKQKKKMDDLEENEEEEEVDDDEDEEDEDLEDKENEIDGIKIHEDTLRLVSGDNVANDEDEGDVLLSSPELHAILQKPAGFVRPKRKNIMQSVLMKQLQTFDLEDIPKESPFK